MKITRKMAIRSLALAATLIAGGWAGLNAAEQGDAANTASLPKLQSGVPAYPPPFMAVARTAREIPQRPASFIIPQPNHKPDFGDRAGFDGFVDMATGQVGFPGSYIQAPLTLAYDRGKLVAYLTIGDPYRRDFRAAAGEPGDDLSGDDTFELLIAPLAPEGRLRHRVYRIVGNPNGIFQADADEPDVGQYRLDWNPTMSCGVNMDAGVAGRRRWNTAIMIPFDDLGGAPADGDIWAVQMVIRYADPAISAALAPHDPVEHLSMAWRHFARVRFDHHRDVNFIGQAFGGNQQQGSFQIGRLFNNMGQTPAKVSLRVELRRAGKEIAEAADETIEVPPLNEYFNLPGRLAVRSPLADDAARDSAARVTATDKSTGQIIYDQFLPFWIPPAGERDWLEEYFGKEFTFMTGVYPAAGAFEFRVECKTLVDANSAAAKLVVRALSEDGEELARRDYPLPPDGRIEDGIAFGKMKDGATYHLTAAIVDREGDAINTKTDTFTRKVMPFETAPKAGLSDIVVAPFTAPEIAGDAVSVWNRTYHHGTQGLMTSLMAADKDLLANPVQFVMTGGNGKKAALTGQKPVLKPLGKGKVEYSQSFNGGGIRLDVEGVLDYDGFYKFSCGLAGDGKPVELAALHLEIPLRPEHAIMIESPLDWNLRDDGIKKQGLLDGRPGVLWDSKSAPYTRGARRRGNMPPFLWLGDDERGLVFSCVSEEGMANDAELPAAVVERRGNEVVMRISLANLPGELSSPRQFEFALQASPYKPMPDHSRLWRTGITSANELFGVYTTNGVAFHTGWGARKGAYPCYSRFACLDTLKNTVDDFKGRGFDFVSANASSISEGAGTPEYLQFWREWSSPLGFDRAPRSPLSANVREEMLAMGIEDPSPLAMVEAVSNNCDSNVDYRIWWLNEEVKHAGVNAIYQDNGMFRSFDQKFSGYGYDLPDAGREPTNAVWNARGFMRRVAHLMVENGVEGSPGVFANLISPAIPGRAFCGIFLTGENPHSDKIPLDTMRVWFSKQWGMIPSWYWSPGDPRRPMTYWRTVCGRLFLHDVVNTTSSGGEVAGNFRRWYHALDAFWLDDPSIVWHPYYRTKLVKATVGPDTKVSAYTAQGRALFVISNQGETDIVEIVAFNDLEPWIKAKATNFYDAETGEPVEVDSGGALRMFIPALGYRLVLAFPEPWEFDTRHALDRPELPVNTTADPRQTVAEMVRQIQSNPELNLATFDGAHPLTEAWIQAIIGEVKASRDANPESVVYHGAAQMAGINGIPASVKVAAIIVRGERGRESYRLVLYLNTSTENLLLDGGASRTAIAERMGVDSKGFTLDPVEGYSFWRYIDLPASHGKIEILYHDHKDYWGPRRGVFPFGTMTYQLGRAAKAKSARVNGGE